MEENFNDPNSQFKLHIDSHLIRSNSSELPDELRDLGVCAYNENEFQKGVLFQVDLQIAQHELEKAKQKLENEERRIKSSTNKKVINNKNDSTNDNKSDDNTKKRKSTELLAENFLEKKVRLESTIDYYNNIINNAESHEDNADEDMISYSPLNDDDSQQTDSNSGLPNKETLIKNGEMTPFGTIIDFEKGFSKENTNQNKKSSKKTQG